MSTEMDTFSQQFRLYLEKSGVIDALTRTLMKLYKEPNKPDDGVLYIRKFLCDECPLEEQYEALKADHIETLKVVANLEEQINRFKGNLKMTEDEIEQAIDNGFRNLTENEDCKTLLKKYATKELLTQSTQTSFGAKIFDCIQSGLEYFESKIGIYAADPECYTIFKDIFDPIILDYYNMSDNIEEQLQKPSDWGDPIILRNLDPDGNHVISVKISISRNLEGYPFIRLLTENQFQEISEKIKTALLSLIDDQFQGTFSTIKEIDPEKYSQMVHKQIAFSKKNKELESAGCYRFWPIGRGIFVTSDENIIVWINAEDHLKIISTAKCGNLDEAYQRLVSFMESIKEGVFFINDYLKFVRNDRYGYLTFSPRNLGSTIEISARVKLSNLLKKRSELDELLNKFNLEIIQTSFEKKTTDNIVEISAKRMLGPTEFESVKNFEEGILELLRIEEEVL